MRKTDSENVGDAVCVIGDLSDMQEGVEKMKENITTIVLTFIILIQMVFNFMTVRYCFTGLWSQQMTVNSALDTISVVQNSIQDKHKG
jgi:hypothetical protein